MKNGVMRKTGKLFKGTNHSFIPIISTYRQDKNITSVFKEQAL